MRKSSNCLHFFINGEDQGMAVSDIPENVFGVVDLYGAAVKVSLCENQSSCSAMANEIINSESQETLFAGKMNTTRLIKDLAFFYVNNTIIIMGRSITDSILNILITFEND